SRDADTARTIARRDRLVAVRQRERHRGLSGEEAFAPRRDDPRGYRDVDENRRREPPADLLGEHTEAGHAEVVVVEPDAVPAELRQLRPERGRVSSSLEERARHLGRDALLEELRGERPELLLLGRQLEIHQRLLGRPRMRSAMIPFWICDVPP